MRSRRLLAALFALALAGAASPAQAIELPRMVLQKIRSAERVDRLGVWEFADHLRDGPLEAGYSKNTDNIIVSVQESSGTRRYYVVGRGHQTHSIIVVPRRGEIQVHSSRAGSEADWRKFVQASLGERSAARRPVRVTPLR